MRSRTIVLLATALLWASVTAANTNNNPFDGVNYYVNPTFQAEIQTSIASCTPASGCSSTTLANLKRMQQTPSAYWLDTMGKLQGSNTSTLEGILADAASKQPHPLVTVIVYDLPNRDCHAKASNGEICCVPNPDGTCNYDSAGDGTCSSGLATYKTQYINVLAGVLSKYPQVPVVAIVEPDSLPNLATNLGDPHCGNAATKAAYLQGIPYAIQTIAAASPNVTMYLDAAHGGWLGWSNNMQDFVQLVQSLDVEQYIRGFSTNVANYQPIGVACQTWDWCLPNNNHGSDPCCNDPCHLSSQYNGAVNEHQYAATLVQFFGQAGFANAHVVIDTGRAGVPGMREQCADWCNIRGSGAGQVPTTSTAFADIDAYYWLKTPGESDGCTQELPNGAACARFDSFCGSVDSIGSQSGEPRAPVAGLWFDYMVKMLAANANLDGVSSGGL